MIIQRCGNMNFIKSLFLLRENIIYNQQINQLFLIT